MTAQENADSYGEAYILDGRVVMTSTDTDIVLRGLDDTVPTKILRENTTESQSVAVVLPSKATKLSSVCGGHHLIFAVYGLYVLSVRYC